MKKKGLVSLASIVFVCLLGVMMFRARADHKPLTSTLPTYYAYSSEQLDPLEKIDSSLTLSAAALQKWDQLADRYVQKNNASFYVDERLYTYLYAAQRDFAFISYNTHDHFAGSIDPISENILTLFFPDYKRPLDYQSDLLSESIASIVFPRYKDRFDQENASQDMHTVPDYLLQKKETSYSSGLEVKKWIPWALCDRDTFKISPPPSEKSPEWENQLQGIRKAQKNMTEKQKARVFFWAGMAGPNTGDWRTLVNAFLFEEDPPFGKLLLVRSLLMMALYDTTIAYCDEKYKYFVMRPKVRDPSLKTLIEAPSHPSYPSGHSSLGGASATIMSYYFPEKTKEWRNIAEEAGMSRIWGGIHYPIDHLEGLKLGRNIAEALLEEEEKPSPQCRR